MKYCVVHNNRVFDDSLPRCRKGLWFDPNECIYVEIEEKA